jgi:hypothetical protein
MERFQDMLIKRGKMHPNMISETVRMRAENSAHHCVYVAFLRVDALYLHLMTGIGSAFVDNGLFMFFLWSFIPPCMSRCVHTTLVSLLIAHPVIVTNYSPCFTCEKSLVWIENKNVIISAKEPEEQWKKIKNKNRRKEEKKKKTEPKMFAETQAPIWHQR